MGILIALMEGSLCMILYDSLESVHNICMRGVLPDTI